MRKNLYRSLVAGIIAMLVLSVWGFAAAQDSSVPPFLGIGLSEAENGVLVEEVVSGSPADQAGLQVGDIITAIGGDDVTAETIREALAGFSAGDAVELGVQRGDETLSLEAILAERPAQQDMPFNFDFNMPFMSDRPMLGVSLEDGEGGAIISAVRPESSAAVAGLEEGDLILRIGDSEIASAQEVVDAVRQLAAGDTVMIEVQRDGETVTVEATLESMPMPNMPFAGDFIAYNGEGWQILSLTEDSPLASAGLQAGDVITEFDGTAYEPQALNDYLKGLAEDAEVTLTVERDGETTEITASAPDLSALNRMGFGMNFGEGMPALPFGQFGGMMGGRLGLSFVTLNDQVAEERGIEQTEGALVAEVAADSPAEAAGVQVDDIITAVNGESVNEEFTLRDRLAAYEPGDVVTLAIQRGSETLNLDVTLGEPEMPFGNREFRFFGPDGLELPFDFHSIPGHPGRPDTTQPNL